MTQIPTSIETLTTHLAELGVENGANVLVHSALKVLGPMEGGAHGVIEALLNAVGPRGTVGMPTHTWANVRDDNPVWHQTHTPSCVGALTNVFRAWPGTRRSLHPTHSLAALGPATDFWLDGHEIGGTPCHPRGPYGRMLEIGAQVLLLGVDFRRLTFFHCLEEIAGCGEIWSLDPVARPRWLVTDEGEVRSSPIRGHLDHKSDNFPRVQSAMLDAGYGRQTRLSNGCPLFLVDCQKAHDWLVPRLRHDPYLFW